MVVTGEGLFEGLVACCVCDGDKRRLILGVSAGVELASRTVELESSDCS